MDRTSEFSKIVKATEIPQWNIKNSGFHREIGEIDNEIKNAIKHIQECDKRQKDYSAKLEAIKEKLKQLKEVKFDKDVRNDRLEIVESLSGIITKRVLEYTIKIRQIERDYKSSSNNHEVGTNALESSNTMGTGGRKAGLSRTIHADDAEYGDFNAAPSQNASKSTNSPLVSMSTMSPSALDSEHASETIAERRRIVNSISEIGQIVEDIAIQVGIQEENLRQIDDIVAKTEYYGKQALLELHETWDSISGRRKGIIKFFVFWIILIIVFFFVRRG